MKRNLQTPAILFLLIAAFITNGCKKEGPQGPPGNANVTSTLFTATTWYYSSPYYYVNLSVPELTSANLNSAMVAVYFRTSSGTWFAVPYTQYNSPYDYYMGFNTSAGQVEITWVYDSSFSSGDDPNVYYGTTVQYKVVIIPPAVRKANPDLDLRNYEAVKAAFHLKD